MSVTPDQLDIVDGHVHVASDRFIPRQFMTDVAANVEAVMTAHGHELRSGRALDILVEQNQDHDADRLVSEMDAAAVSQAVLLAPDFGLAMPSSLTLEEVATAHHAIRLRHPGRFFFFAGVDPRRGREGIEFFASGIDRWDIDGLKLYPPCGFSPSDRMLDPYYEICRDRGLPVFIHTGPTVRSLEFDPAHPMNVDAAAVRFPGVDFVLGHGGVTHVSTAAYLAQYRMNVHLDIGGFAGGNFAGGWEEHLRGLFHSSLNDKVLFGTDWPLNRMSGGLRRLVGRFRGADGPLAGVSGREQKLVLAGNVRRLLAKRVAGPVMSGSPTATGGLDGSGRR